jgi:hypothetical protein
MMDACTTSKVTLQDAQASREKPFKSKQECKQCQNYHRKASLNPNSTTETLFGNKPAGAGQHIRQSYPQQNSMPIHTYTTADTCARRNALRQHSLQLTFKTPHTLPMMGLLSPGCQA